MTNKVKKAITGFMALASFATGMVSMGASAAEVTTPVNPEIIDEYNGPDTVRNFDDTINNHATATGNAGSTWAFFSTSDAYASRVSINIVNPTSGTINGQKYWYADGTYISNSYSGSNITKVSCRHSASESIGDGYTTITRFVS